MGKPKSKSSKPKIKQPKIWLWNFSGYFTIVSLLVITIIIICNIHSQLVVLSHLKDNDLVLKMPVDSSIKSNFIDSLGRQTHTTHKDEANITNSYVHLNKVTTIILKLFLHEKDDKFNAHDAEVALKIILDSLVFLATIFAIAYPFIESRKAKIKANLNRSIHRFSINVKKGEDLDWMYKFYEDADSVIVFAGDYDWLRNEDLPLTKRVTELVNQDKIKFFSNKTQEAVKKNIPENLYTLIETKELIKYVPLDRKIRCSLVTQVNRSTLIFRDISTQSSPEQDTNYEIFIIPEWNNNSYLLSIIQNLMGVAWDKC